jgi:hypothetical protein
MHMDGLRVAKLLAAGALVLAGALGTRSVAAQRPGQTPVVFVGTVVDSAGAPPPTTSSLQLVVPGPPGFKGQRPTCASGATDANGNFQLTLFPLAAGCSGAGNPLQLLVNGIPATQIVTIPPTGGTYGIYATLAVPLGGQPLGQIAASPRTTALAIGCSQVILALGTGAVPSQIAGFMANPAALVSIWRFDNGLKRFAAYFADPAAPSDLNSLAPVDTVFVCVSASTSITAP